jgi:hypothetical protein
MKNDMRNVAIVVLMLAVAGCASAPRGQAIKTQLKKTEDSVAVTTTRDATVVSVTSKSGIGGATLVRLGETWPTRIVIRLKLNNLESFGMSNGDIRFNTSIRSPGRMPYWKIGRNEKQSDAPDGTLEVPIRRADESFEIAVPSEMTKGNPAKIDFGWINEFRG